MNIAGLGVRRQTLQEPPRTSKAERGEESEEKGEEDEGQRREQGTASKSRVEPQNAAKSTRALERPSSSYCRRNGNAVMDQIRIPDPFRSKKSECTDFYAPRSVALSESLKQMYDPTGQGVSDNPELHTFSALCKRDSLKYEPEVVKVLDAMWQVIDRNNNQEMDESEYKLFHRKLAMVLLPTISEESLQELCSHDWKRDTENGSKKIVRSTFGDSMFELTDRWTDDISAKEYVDFLQGMLQAFSTVDPLTGRREYKSDNELRSSMLLLAKPLSKLHGKSLMEARERAAAEERARARAFRLGIKFDLIQFEQTWEISRGVDGTERYPSNATPMEIQRSKSLGSLGDASFGKRPRKSRRQSRRQSFDVSAETPEPERVGNGGSVDDSKEKSYLDESSVASLELCSFDANESVSGPNERVSQRRDAEEHMPSVPSTPALKKRVPIVRERNPDSPKRRQQEYQSVPWHLQTVVPPNSTDLLGVVVFDPYNPEEIVRLGVSTIQGAVVECERLPLIGACKLGSHGLLTISRTVHHVIEKSEWKQFCANVDQLANSRRGHNEYEMAFVGVATAYGPQQESVSHNIHFSSYDVASRFTNVCKRPPSGLACPVLQNKIAKFITHSVRLKFRMLTSQAPALQARISFPLRSNSAQLLLAGMNSLSVAVSDHKLPSSEPGGHLFSELVEPDHAGLDTQHGGPSQFLEQWLDPRKRHALKLKSRQRWTGTFVKRHTWEGVRLDLPRPPSGKLILPSLDPGFPKLPRNKAAR